MKQLWVIHGGDSFETHEEYLDYLRTKEVTLEYFSQKGWKSTLADRLVGVLTVYSPRMPNMNDARYAEWKIWFEKITPLMTNDVFLLGHSLGGIFLVKYLSEHTLPISVQALFLVAPPYNTPTEHPLVDFTLEKNLDGVQKQCKQIYLFHSKDDRVVPFSNFERYAKEFLEAKQFIFEDRGHFNQEEFPEIVEELKKATT